MSRKTKRISAPEDFVDALDFSVDTINQVTPKKRKVDRTSVMEGFSKAIQDIAFEIAKVDKPNRRRDTIGIEIKTKKRGNR